MFQLPILVSMSYLKSPYREKMKNNIYTYLIVVYVKSKSFLCVSECVCVCVCEVTEIWILLVEAAYAH